MGHQLELRKESEAGVYCAWMCQGSKKEDLAGRQKRASNAGEIKAGEHLKEEEQQSRVQDYSKFDLVMDQ